MTAVHPLLALLIGLGLTGVLVLLLRWTYGRGRSLVARRPHAGNPDEYGLLVSVAAPADPDEALRMSALLTAEGVRHTLVETSAGPRLMVWPDDSAKARQALDRR
ncbi:hypothetical protein [Kitasatospora sp. DSM 101779]|uniref:hypothetical protein n=1 Tax=Kitasatospora sp. DSM 101779 TaxID=2853165 RepID=UPI0021D9893B|nr:hypothetical protein [Kitasatospora sp. DSM 101779]MCU7822818.1 hypothetical protein [Kitasatospora sp. DSM 101779]